MYDSHNRKGVFMVHTPRGVVEFHPKTLRWLIFWSMMILMTILLRLTLPLRINFTSTLSTRTLRVVIQRNKFNKLCALAASWAWLPVTPNVISKPWYVSTCLKTAQSQTTTFAMLTTFMALTLHQSEARRSGRSLRE
jgi:hypothetical protein